MHIPSYDNVNRAIVNIDDEIVPLVYLNIVRLRGGQKFISDVEGYETCVVPALGTVDVRIVGPSFTKNFDGIGERTSIWDKEPSGVYVPVGRAAHLQCRSETAEVFIAGARFAETFEPFAIRAADIDSLQYGSDETKTHRKIKHILGQHPPGRVGRLLVSELFTVGAGGWSGFPPHKHDTENLPQETRHEEVYSFRFRPEQGFGLQLIQASNNRIGQAFHVTNGSTIKIAGGYHPCVAAPGYEMYYFTVIAGAQQRPLVQHFHPDHAYQVDTIPGIKAMIAKFKE